MVALSRSVRALAGDVSGELSLDNMFPTTERTLYLYSWTLCQMGLLTRGGEGRGRGKFDTIRRIFLDELFVLSRVFNIYLLESMQ